MRKRDLSLPRFLALPLCLLLIPIAALAQTPAPLSRVVERVNDGDLVTLRGNTHPLAQPRFDQGIAPSDLPMARMLLVLKRSDAQESALETFLDAQQNKNSPSYHQWLTPDQFGQQFGPSDQDMQAIQLWLGLHGFQIGAISGGRTVIEFSGTAQQVQQTFHTEIHKYLVNGVEHWANASDPQIPSALAPVIEGVNSLHNFSKKPLYRLARKSSKGGATSVSQGLGPETTILDPSLCGDFCYFVSPYDFATIYNVLPLWNAKPAIDGTGQTIAIINRSNINLQDVSDFRNLFGLPSAVPNVILNGPDPGPVPNDETEADLDVEWSGAVAKGATIDLVIAQSTTATDGVDLAAIYAVENNVAPIMSESFGQCELFLGNAGNVFANSIRQQAAAQGITYITSTGDQGSAVCDADLGQPPAPATFGLAVNGLASTPYGVAVGGTDFLNFGPSYNINAPSPYWSEVNDPTHQASALGYVPETTWNDSCTNAVWVFLKVGSTPEAACNNPQLDTDVLVGGGSGGKSTCITSNGALPSNCSAGYTKPSWQSAPGVPADNARDVPDVSLFASDNFMGSSYIVCQSDQQGINPCNLSDPLSSFVGIGGTSASAPAFAGMMALVNQSTGSSGEGNANYVLYKMASSSTQTSKSCGATAAPAAGCIFYDVTSGTIAMPCAKGSTNCNTSNGSDTYGVLSGYSATNGYDLATGLGSINASNLVHNWIQPANSSSVTLMLNGGNPVNITHGQNVSFSIEVTPSAAPGVVALMGSPSGSGFVPLASFPLQNGAASGNTATLAGGKSYSVKAHYPGSGTYAPSDSTPITVTVSPEPSKTLITIPVFNASTGHETGNMPSSITYGTPVGVRVDVGNASATTTFPPQPVCAVFLCSTGIVTVNDSYNGGAAAPIPGSGGFTLNSQAYAENDGFLLFAGTHQFTASYPGDGSYASSTGNYTLTITPAPMQLSFLSIPAFPPVVGVPVTMYATFNATNSFPGVGPTGTIAFFDGATQIPGTVTYGNGQPGGTFFPASFTGYITVTFSTIGIHQVTAKYSGDANYAAATGSATSASAVYSVSLAATASPTNLNLGQNVNLSVTLTGGSKTPPITGSFQFSGQFTGPTGPATATPGTDVSGNQTLTETITVTPTAPTSISVTYPGDTNYESSETFVNVPVNIPDFSFNGPANPLLVTAGQPGSLPIEIDPSSSIASAVMLSCGGSLPTGYICGISPATLNLSGGASNTFMLTLTPAAPGAGNAVKRIAIAKAFPQIPAGPRGFLGLGLLAGLAGLAFFAAPRRTLRWRLAGRLTLISVVTLALGCGAGSSGSGGGGGVTPPAQTPTTTTVATSAAKVNSQSQATFTATVTGTQNPTGDVQFYLSGVYIGVTNLVGNTATLTTSFYAPGDYSVTAQYFGDGANAPSTSSAISQYVTGTTSAYVQGQTSTITHYANVQITVQ